MAKRLINTVLKHNNYKCRIEVVDLLGSGLNLDHEVEVSVPGPTLSYDGAISNHTTPVIGSSLEFTAFLTVNQRNDLMGVLYSDTEYSLAVGYYLYDEEDNEFLEWCGLVLPDETAETVESSGGTVTVTFKCTDGLPILNHINFITPDTSSFYTGEFSLAFWLREVLKKLPHWNYYFSGITSIYLKEVGLPIPSDATYSFDDTSNTLDSSYVHARTFYANRRRLNTKRQLPTPEESFSSTYAVLEDIMLSMGASFVLTRGCWYAVNRSYFAIEVAASDTVPVSGYYNTSSAPYYETYDGQESFIIDIGRDSDPIRSGATRTALFPYRGVEMTHKNSGSDLIFGRGVGYNGFDNNDVNANSPMYSVEDDDWGSNDAYNMWAVGSSINPSYINNLNIAAGDEGMLTIAMSGLFSMDKKVSLSSEGTSRHGVGACPIVRNIVKITDSNGKSWRLKRHVLTLNSFKSSILLSNFMDSLGYPLGLGQDEYYPKYYQNGGAYSWVGDDEAGYDIAYFETMLGMDPDVVLEGSTERFLEIDYPNTKFYTPIKTEISENEEGSDNVLRVRHNDDRCRYLWKLNYNLEMPELPTGYIESFEWVSHQLLVYGPENGPRPTGDGTYTVPQTPSFATAQSEVIGGYTYDNSYEPIEYVVYGCSVKVGDGTETSDIQYLAFDTSYNGSEVHSIGETRIGSSYQNRFYGLNGKIRATLYDGPVQLTAREDNLYWSPRYDNTVVENALLYLNCAEFMQLRYRTRQMVSMSVINDSGLYNTFLRPINLVRTDVLGVGGEEILMPIALRKSMEDTAAEFFVVAFDRDAPLEAVDVNGRNPFDTDSPSGPGITDGSNDGPGAISNVKNLLAQTNGKVSVNSSKISDLKDWQTITDPVVEENSKLVQLLYKTFNPKGDDFGATVLLYEEEKLDGTKMSLLQNSVELSSGTGNSNVTLTENSPGIFEVSLQDNSVIPQSRTALFIEGDKTGNRVGINTNSPTYNLEVIGDAYIEQDLDIDGSVVGAQSIHFSTNPGATPAAGELLYDGDDDALLGGLSAGTFNVLDDPWLVKNQTGSTIEIGTPVYVNGTLGSSGRKTIAPYIADGSIDSRYFLGVVAHDIADGEDGIVLHRGTIKGFNTSTLSGVLYVSDTVAGEWTTTAPSSPSQALAAAFVINAATNGTIAVRVAPDENATGGGGGIVEVVEDTSPQLGGDLDGNGYNIDLSGNTASQLIITGNQYAFRYRSTNGVLQNTGLYFNLGTGSYEFLNGSANCIFCIKAGSGELSIGDMASSNHFIMPNARGSAGQIFLTDGSGNVDWASLTAGNNLTITPNPGTNSVTFTPSLTPTLNSLTTTGLILSGGDIQTVGNLSVGANTTLVGAVTTQSSLTVGTSLITQGISFTGGATSTIGIATGLPNQPDDLEIRSNGNVVVALDYDDDEEAQAFIVKDSQGNVILRVDEAGITSGVFVSESAAIQTISDIESTQGFDVTITNYKSSTQYIVRLYDSTDTIVDVTPTDNEDGSWSFAAGLDIGTGYYVQITTLDFGLLASAPENSNTFDVNPAQTQQRYWRLVFTDASKNPTALHGVIGDMAIYTGSGQTGTKWPTSAMTSNNTPTPFVVSSGYYNGSYYDWRAFDNVSSAGSMWWTLSGATTSNNWLQVDLGSSVNMASASITTYGSYMNANYAVLYGSNTGAFAGEEREMAFFQNIKGANGVWVTYNVEIT